MSSLSHHDDQVDNVEAPLAPGEKQEAVEEIEVTPPEDLSTPEPAAEEAAPTEPAPTEESPAAETLTEEAPAEVTPVEEEPTVAAPAEETPTSKVPTEVSPTKEAPAPETHPEEEPSIETPVAGPPTTDEPAEPHSENEALIPAAKISKFHYLIPASKSNLHLCFNLVSSAANRYPVPTILGWNGAGLFDAAKTHLAKLRAIERYLNALESEEDDDLVVIVDGYDIILQLPPEIMIERYFEVANKADARIARRFGISVKEARARGLRETIFWGPDKICWPIDAAESRCWAVPESSLPPDAFGPQTGNGDMLFSNPRWLNSGTVIGPVGDMKALIAATMEEINATYNTEYEFKESDQYYISNIWGRQEYYRSLKALPGEEVRGGPPDRHIPSVRSEHQKTEFHIGIDYESALFQTKAGYEPFFGYLEFNTSGLNGNMNVDMFGEGDDFVPFDISMPANVYSALGKLYESIADIHPGMVTNDWIRTIKLGTNFITEHIFPLWHCTGPKQWIVDEFPKMWFYPYAEPLVKATVKAFQGDELITNHLVDGRKWAPKNRYPGRDALTDELGGAWTDLNGGGFVEWHELCGSHAGKLFGGDEPPPPSVHQSHFRKGKRRH